MGDGFLVESMLRFVGQTVTIFTTSGGLSGSGFTGVLAGICHGNVKLITDIGACLNILQTNKTNGPRII